MKPVLTQAGPYKVNWVPCPFSRKRVQLDLPRAGILHTTEGGFEGSLEVFEQHYAPHFEVGLDKGLGEGAADVNGRDILNRNHNVTSRVAGEVRGGKDDFLLAFAHKFRGPGKRDGVRGLD